MKKVFNLEIFSSFLPFLKGQLNLTSYAVADVTLNNNLYTQAIPQAAYSNNYGNSSVNSKKIRRYFKNSKYLPFIVVILLFGMIAFLSLKIFATHTKGVVAGTSDSRLAVKPPLAQETLDKEFSFPLRDGTGKEVSQLKYVIQNAELRDEIIIQGQQATSVKGRAFLIFNLKITNSYDKSVKINARDYVRLIVNGSSERLAPDIHNDPVEVQAISTKYTRLGFPIDDNYKSLVLQVGEITGSKQQIPLNLR